jgi:hypothetical protein
MYFNNDGKIISAKIRSHNNKIFHDFWSLHSAALATRTEIQYFRHFFPALQNYINALRIPGVLFQCRAKEIHSSPLVTYGTGKTCELGDYILIVKYKNRNVLIGKKLIIYQLKRTHTNSWSIDQKQLKLLRDWPTFCFGRTTVGKNTYTLRPTRPEYGSFVLIRDNHPIEFYSDVYGSAYDISNNQFGKSVRFTDIHKFHYSGLFSYFKLLTWEIGEPIIENTDIADFTSALYRYMEWEEDPPNEFIQYEKKGEENSFWGIEITVSAEEGLK